MKGKYRGIFGLNICT